MGCLKKKPYHCATKRRCWPQCYFFNRSAKIRTTQKW